MFTHKHINENMCVYVNNNNKHINIPFHPEKQLKKKQTNKKMFTGQTDSDSGEVWNYTT